MAHGFNSQNSFETGEQQHDQTTMDGSMLSLLPVVPHDQQPPHMPLSVLIEFAVHRVYQRLTVLAELLAKKTDVDRKISILEFAHHTRTLFVQLLALVKWLKTIASTGGVCTVRTYLY
jgi:hypothetical protein